MKVLNGFSIPSSETSIKLDFFSVVLIKLLEALYA